MININIDTSEISELLNLQSVASKAVKDAAAALTVAVHHKITELANVKLHSRREMFIKALSYEQVSDDTWHIILDASARFIDDGSPPRDMLDDLLKSPKAKVAKDGSKYIKIPFKHGPGKGPANSTPAQMDLTSTVKAAMKSKGIPFSKIEKDASGKAKFGRLHSFSVNDSPMKTHFGPGMGHGPIGQVRQGMNQRQAAGGGPGGGGTPFLKGVNVYQSPDAKAASGARRDIVSFRIASSKHKSEGRWRHPGNPPINAMLDGLNWGLEEFNSKIAPEIMAKISAEISK